MKRAGLGWSCLWACCGLFAAMHAHASPHWGLEVGSRLGSFGWGEFGDSPQAPPDEDRRRVSGDGGVVAEWTAGKRCVAGAGLAYEELGAGRHQYTGFSFNDGTRDIGLWEDRFIRLKGIGLDPSIGVRFGPGLRLSFGPELLFLLEAEEMTSLSSGPVQSQAPPLRAQGQIFEQVRGGQATDVTGRFERWIPGWTLGAGWERGFAGHLVRLDARYHSMLGEPDRGRATTGSIRTLRLALALLL